MKKIILAIAIVMTMGLGASAQRGSDGFFNNSENYSNRGDMSNPTNLGMPGAAIGDQNNSSAPLGSGLLVLTALGAGYALKENYKKRNKNR